MERLLRPWLVRPLRAAARCLAPRWRLVSASRIPVDDIAVVVVAVKGVLSLCLVPFSCCRVASLRLDVFFRVPSSVRSDFCRLACPASACLLFCHVSACHLFLSLCVHASDDGAPSAVGGLDGATSLKRARPFATPVATVACDARASTRKRSVKAASSATAAAGVGAARPAGGTPVSLLSADVPAVDCCLPALRAASSSRLLALQADLGALQDKLRGVEPTTRDKKTEATMLVEKLHEIDEKLAKPGLRQETESHLRAMWQSYADDKKVANMALASSMLDERRIKDSMEARRQQIVAEQTARRQTGTEVRVLWATSARSFDGLRWSYR